MSCMYRASSHYRRDSYGLTKSIADKVLLSCASSRHEDDDRSRLTVDCTRVAPRRVTTPFFYNILKQVAPGRTHDLRRKDVERNYLHVDDVGRVLSPASCREQRRTFNAVPIRSRRRRASR